jgi:hypothetical protein
MAWHLRPVLLSCEVFLHYIKKIIVKNEVIWNSKEARGPGLKNSK